jgi:hypothetical protein
MPESTPGGASFPIRHDLVKPSAISFRDDLPAELREPLISILYPALPAVFLLDRIKHVYDPYGIANWPSGPPIRVSKEEDDPDFVTAKRFLMNCEWFWLYTVIEDIFDQLTFYERELCTDEEEEPRAYPLQSEMNDYFKYAGIGWQMVEGRIVARGDDVFEQTVRRAETELVENGRSTAADRIRRAISNLSARPQPDRSGAISHATGAIECVLDDITGQHMTLGAFLRDPQHSKLFPGSMKKALEGIWGFSSEEGARHGREGIEPSREDSEFIVAIAAAVTTYLTRKSPRPDH